MPVDINNMIYDGIFFIHNSAIVKSDKIGVGTRIWAFVHILAGAVIGDDCNICDHVFIENDVIIGDRVTIKCGVQLWDGVTLEDDVFIGPNVTFTNDKHPRSKQYQSEVLKTTIRKGASIGANATILPGIIIDQYAMIGAGTVVTRNVPPYAKVVGNPGRIVGYVDTETHVSLPANASDDNFTSSTGAKIIAIPSVTDIRGDLSIIEMKKLLPFTPRRIFYTYNVPSSEVRGEHAHKECQQFLIALSGSLHIIADNGGSRDEFVLDNPRQGLLLPAEVWGIQYKHSPGTVLLVLASHEYDAADYIRNYDEYKEYIKNKN